MKEYNRCLLKIIIGISWLLLFLGLSPQFIEFLYYNDSIELYTPIFVISILFGLLIIAQGFAGDNKGDISRRFFNKKQKKS